MQLDPIATSTLLIEIPGAIAAIKDLVRNSKNNQVDEKISLEVERLKKAIINYASMHYALSELKELHDRLQMVDRSLEKLQLEGSAPSIDSRVLKMVWSGFALNQLARLQSLAKELRWISATIDLTSPTQPSKIINWPEEFRSHASAIEQEISRKKVDEDNCREKIDEFVTLIRDSMTSVDRQLRNLAAELADTSQKLDGAIQGI